VLLLDEPTAGLDWAMRADILELLADLARERAVLVVTHEANLFAPIAGDSWRLELGVLRPLRSPELAGVSAGVSNPLAPSAAADGPP
jgi:energy-coupling factor transport system ATP-binding protein